MDFAPNRLLVSAYSHRSRLTKKPNRFLYLGVSAGQPRAAFVTAPMHVAVSLQGMRGAAEARSRAILGIGGGGSEPEHAPQSHPLFLNIECLRFPDCPQSSQATPAPVLPVHYLCMITVAVPTPSPREGCRCLRCRVWCRNRIIARFASSGTFFRRRHGLSLREGFPVGVGFGLPVKVWTLLATASDEQEERHQLTA